MSTIALRSLPAIVPGYDYARTLQGNTPAGIAGTGFLSSDTLSATISPGQGLASLFSPTVAWSSAASCQFVLSISGAQSAGLSIDVPAYYGLVEATRSGVTYPIAAFYLPTLPVPGTQAAAAPPDLVAIPYAAQLLSQLGLNEPQWESIPTLITASSDAIRSWCNRRFDQGSVVEEVPVEYDGTVRLARPPINFIQRIQCRPQVALTVANTTASTAWVDLATTGDVASGLVITGMTLNWESGGIASTQTITYTNNETIATLATAINAVGSGWTATADSILGAWPVTEIMDGLASKGAGPLDTPGAEFHVYSQNISNARFLPDDGQRTGMVWVGYRWGYSDAGRWGPGGESLFGDRDATDNRVRVSYNGGFATVPREVQLACVELAKAQLSRLKSDLMLRSETAADFSYEINVDEVKALPTHVLQGLSRHRLTNA